MSSEEIKEELARCTSMLAFPRRTGTPDNEKARTIIADQLKNDGLDVHFEEFIYNTTVSTLVNVAIAISLITSDFLIFEIAWYSFYCLKWLQVILGFIMLGMLLVSFSIPVNARWRTTRPSSEKKSRHEKIGVNIVAEVDNENARTGDMKESVAIVGAHYDSISLLFPPKFSLILYLMNSIGVLVIAVLAVFEGTWYLIEGDSSLWLRIVESMLALLALFTLLARFFNKRSNQSRGAVDNATGCAVLLLLAKRFTFASETMFSKIRFVFFDAEEEGLWGSLHHALHGPFALDRRAGRNAIAFSLDEVGGPGRFMASESYGFPRVTRSPENWFLTVFHDLVTREGIKIMKTWYPYAASDHAPFIVGGASATWLAHVYMNANSRKDNVEDANEGHMLETLELMEKFLKEC
ncbi:MAG TPA: M28 family peptidase [Candidatus Lokiarchaeia archaeon]|nr:M28 family peptidase [Candidatus Lokiarchaeia archaeon]